MAVLVCDHVFRDERPVLLAVRDDALVCLLCGQDDHTQSVDSFMVVGHVHPVDNDPTVAAVLDLQVGEEAERSSAEAAWVRRHSDPQPS